MEQGDAKKAAHLLKVVLGLLTHDLSANSNFVANLRKKFLHAIRDIEKEEIQSISARVAKRYAPSVSARLNFVKNLSSFKKLGSFKNDQTLILETFLKSTLADHSRILWSNAAYFSDLTERSVLLRHCSEDYVFIPNQASIWKDKETKKKYMANGRILFEDRELLCLEAEELTAEEPRLVAIRTWRKAPNMEHIETIADVTAKVKGTHVVKLIASFKEGDTRRLVVVTDHHGVDLETFIETNKLTHRQIHQLFRDLVHGVNQVHSTDHVMGNLNPSNVMVEIDPKTGRLSAKISLLDASFVGQAIDPRRYQRLYLAPEVRKTSQRSRAGDIFSVGEIMCTILEKYVGVGSSELLGSLTDELSARRAELGKEDVVKFRRDMQNLCQGEWKREPVKLSVSIDSEDEGNDQVLAEMSESLRMKDKKNAKLTKKVEQLTKALAGYQEKERIAGLWYNKGEPPAQLTKPTITASGVVHEDKFYITGGAGLKCTQVYDTQENRWTVHPSEMGLIRCSHASCLIGGSIYNFGGMIDAVYSISVEAMDIGEGVWRNRADLTGQPRGNLRASAIGTNAILSGGTFADNTQTNEVLIYNTENDQYTQGANLLQGRHYHISEAIGGCVFVGGGFSAADINSCEAYDPNAGLWTKKNPMTITAHGQASSLLDENTIVVSGGFSTPKATSITDMMLYDQRQGSWKTLPAKLQNARSYHQQVVVDKKLVVFGGTGFASNAELVDLRV
eukprot:TRINITY_DN4804_c0_g1_i1.p1 TRINITY_DN4804_c0_g1~~TRINITY_DN4804_c0_g1_i1.p1  ORF type:complete len:733 (-),score=182.62 TRINITY_DN4804_c0_g1_i1:8-2206(-)